MKGTHTVHTIRYVGVHIPLLVKAISHMSAVLKSGGLQIPEPGEVVRVRTRTYLVEAVEVDGTSQGTIVRLACLDDDAQGQQLEVVWELELATEILDGESWHAIGKRWFRPAAAF